MTTTQENDMTDEPNTTDATAEGVKWPRKIFASEVGEDVWSGTFVTGGELGWAAVIDVQQRDAEMAELDFHEYIDVDIFESAERYHAARHDAVTAERDALRAQVEALELAIATHGADACGRLKAHDLEAGKKAFAGLRDALATKGTT